MAFLTDRTLTSGVARDNLVHIVITGDTSQNPAGSSYKATLGQIIDLYTGGTDVFVTGFTYGQNTLNIQQNNNSVYSVTINEMTGLTINGNLVVTGNTHLESTTASTLNISTTPTTDTNTTPSFLTRDSSSGEVKVKQIPGPTVYGLFAQTGNSTVISATTVESSLINGGIGTLTVPANGFSIGDSFRADFGGVASFKNNDTIRIKIKSGTIILADSGTQTMVGATDDVWQLSVNFTIRQIGTAGNASIITLGVFHTTKQSNASPEGFAFNSINNTTFDTTISNTLDVTIQFSSSSALNKIYSDIFVLNKIY